MSGSRFTKMNKKKPMKASSSTSNPQRTLFQSWGSRISSDPSVSSKASSGTNFCVEQFRTDPGCNNDDDAIDVDDEDEDELLMQALEQSTNLSREIGVTCFEPKEDAAEIDLSLIPDLPGFDKYAGRKWIYPTNYPVREYQFNIVKSALFQNTLVALPTGLGKTFIAAVVMFNFYRWYPLSKIVFMAPTKPLVTQQIEACYNIMGIPQSDIAEMTGKMSPVARQKAWKEKRVIFLTPQILSNDLTRGTCEAAKIKCLVVDEAHRSLGNYAYCLVVKELVKINRNFRILALSATPGSNLTMVQDVISNLLISNIELRTDDSAEIKMYSFERKVEKIVVPLGEELKDVEKQYLELLESVVNRLVRQNVLYKRNVKALSKFLILKCRDEFRQNPPRNLRPPQMGVIEGDFALAMSLYHGYELLQLHGLRSFYQFLQSLVNGDKGYGRTRSELMKNGCFMNVFDYLTNKFGQRPSITFTQQTSQEQSEEYIIGHPKLEKLQEIVLEHFRKFQKDDGSTDTRVIIFSQYRNSVSDITEMLKRQQPLIKVISFMGQAAKKESKGFTQKEQLRVMKAFRDGNYNTLVSTCVGEEGLDIGDVDLIICFDASKSPIRLVQRMGRTGRKRDGRIIMLVTEGKEEQIYKQSEYNKNSINKALQNGTKTLRYYQESPRMLPDCLEPQCHRMYITIKNEFENLETEKARIKNEKKNKKVAKRKMKTIVDLLAGESSMDGRLSSMSNSNSPNPNTELLAVVEHSDAEDNLGRSSPPTYMILSDDADELPDLSSQNVVAEVNNKREKSCSKTTKKKRCVQKENTKKKKVRKKMGEPFLIIPDNDDDNASDFIEEREPGSNLHGLNGNGTIEFLLKSQSKQEPRKYVKVSDSKEHQDSGVSKNNCAETSLVPAAPSLENISEMLDNLEAQGQQRTPPDLNSLVDTWDKEFNERIKPAAILSSSSRLEEKEEISTHTHIQTMSPAELSSDCVTGNNEEEAFSSHPKRLDLKANNDDNEILDKSLAILNKRKRKLPFESVDCEESKKSKSLKSPERERRRKGEEVCSNVSSISISPPQNCPSSESFSLDVDRHKEQLLCNEVYSSKSEQQRSKSREREKNAGSESPRENCLSSPHLSPYKQTLPFTDIGSPKSATFQILEASEKTSSEKVRPIPFRMEYRDGGKQKTCKDISTRENSNLVDSCGDLFTDFSSSLNERSIDKFPEAENRIAERSAIHDSGNSDKVVNERAISSSSDDDHPIFDLTADMFSDDELFGTEYDPAHVRVDDNSSVPKVLSEINTHESMDSGVCGKSRSVPSKLSSLIVSFVNSRVSIDPSKGDTTTTTTTTGNGEDEELPLFDLGLDFDVFPPTPELRYTQPLFSRISQSNVGSSTSASTQNNKDVSKTESHPRTENGSTTVEEANLISSEEEDLGGFRLVLPAVNVSGHLQCHSTPCATKRNSSEELLTPCLIGNEKTSPSLSCKNEEDNVSQSSFVSQGFDLKFDELFGDDSLAEDMTAVETNSQKASDTVEDEDSFCVHKKKKKSAVLTSPLLSIQSDAASDTVEDEDSFCVRKKKKKSAVLTSPLLSIQSDNYDVVQNRFATKRRKTGDENGKVRKKSHRPGRRAKQLEGREFLDEEAALSGSDDGISDEELEDGDAYDHSFINDFSQGEQTQNMVDMRAVYLQSVVSPVVKHHGYKMRYRPSARDVYSCAPESDDDYEHDSFCVDSADSSVNETTTFIDLSSCEEETQTANVPKKSKKQRIIRPESSSEGEPVETEGISENSSHMHGTRKINENKEQPKGVVLDDKRNQPIQILDSQSEDECENSDPLVIFAASREISGAQDIISDLRLKHKLNVVVTKLEACDYMVSLRTAVDRKVMSDFVNGANNKKLVKRLQDMCDYYERPCLIVEKNPQKGSESKNVSRQMPQTKYLETLLTQLSLGSIRLLFSENKNETCTLLASLCCQENVKGQAICKNHVLSDSQQQRLKFYVSLPKVNYALALNLCQNFKTIKEFLESSVSLIVTRSKMSSERAGYIHKFIRQKFQ